MVGSAGVQTFSHNTRLSASAMRKEGTSAARSNSDDSSSCLTGGSPRSSNESPSSGRRAKRERSAERVDTYCVKGGAALKGKRRFVGVRQRPSGRWVSEIKDTTQKIRLWLGTFDTAEAAARAYDEAAWLIRGANTRTNFVVAPSENSALPSKAARLLLLRKNAIAAAAATAKPGSGDDSDSKQFHQRQKIQSLSENLYSRASASAEPQRATPLSIHFLPAASDAPVPQNPKSFHQQQQAEIRSASQPMSTPRISMLSSDSSIKCDRLLEFDSNSSVIDEGERCFRSSLDLRRVKVERSPPESLANGMGVPEGKCGVEVNPRANLSRGNNSCPGFSVAEEMCSRELVAHDRPSAVNGNASETKYNNCNDGAREISRATNSGAAFQVHQGVQAALQDQTSSPPLAAQQDSFDTNVSSPFSALDDVDLGCVDSDFDFAAEMSMACSDNETARINLDSLFNGSIPTFSTSLGDDGGAACSEKVSAAEVAREAPDAFSGQIQKQKIVLERQTSAQGLYAMNGVQECLMLYNNNPAPYCMSSPSLSLPPSFGKAPFPFKNSSCMSQGWSQQPSYSRHEPGQFTSSMEGNAVSMHSNICSESGVYSRQTCDYGMMSNSVGAELLTHGEMSQQLIGTEGPSSEALWNSWEFPPLCPVT